MTLRVANLLLQKRIWQLKFDRSNSKARFVSACFLHQPVAHTEEIHQLENAIQGAVWASAGEMIVADMRFTRDSFDYWSKAPMPSSTTLKALASTWARADPCSMVPFEFSEKTMGKKLEDFLQRLVADIEQKKGHVLKNRKVLVKLVDGVNEEGYTLQEEKGSIDMELVGTIQEKGEALQHEAKHKEKVAAEDEAGHVGKIEFGTMETMKDECAGTYVEMESSEKEIPTEVQEMKGESEPQHVAKETANEDSKKLQTDVKANQGEKEGREMAELRVEIKPLECKYVEEDMVEINKATQFEVAEKGKGEAQSIEKPKDKLGVLGGKNKEDVTRLERILNHEATPVEKDCTGKEVVMEVVAEKEVEDCTLAAEEPAKRAGDALGILEGEHDKEEDGMEEKKHDVVVAKLVEKKSEMIEDAMELQEAQGEEEKLGKDVGKVEEEVKEAGTKDGVAMEKRKERMKGLGKEISHTEPLVEDNAWGKTKQAGKGKVEDADKGRYTNGKPLHVELEHKGKLNIVQIRKKKSSGRVHI